MIKNIAFDFDGTLWTAKNLSIITLETIYRTLFNKVAPIEEFKKLTWLTVKEKLHHLDSMNGDILYNEWVNFYGENFLDYIETYDGLVEMIKTLHTKGIRLSVVSNKRVELITIWLEKFGILEYFEGIYWAQNLPQPKPSEEVVPFVLNQNNGKKEEFMLIWDSLIDYETCKNAGVKFGLANWCGKDLQVIIDLNPDYIFDTPTDILYM